MKIFAVRDEDNTTNKAVAYLFCYEKEKRFYIELPEEADPWETPLILSSFLKIMIHLTHLFFSFRIPAAANQLIYRYLKQLA